MGIAADESISSIELDADGGGRCWDYVTEIDPTANPETLYRWIEARAFIHAFGAAAEAKVRQKSFWDVFEKRHCGQDAFGIADDCGRAGLSDAQMGVARKGRCRVDGGIPRLALGGASH